MADEMSSSEELSGQLRTPANEGGCAKDAPWQEVKVNLPTAVVAPL